MPKLVFIPGLLCTQSLFAPQIDALSQHASYIVADITGLDSITAMAERILHSYEGDMIIVGLSMGGYVAMEMIRLSPMRIKALALLSTTARTDSRDKLKYRQNVRHLAQIGTFKGVTPKFLPMLLSPRALANTNITNTVMQMAKDVGQTHFIHQQTAIINRIDQRETLRRYHNPCLVLCGALDQVTPPFLSDEIAMCLCDRELVIIPDTGHLPTLESPDICNAALLRLIRRIYGSNI